MRKLLALTLILGLTSLANASIDLSVNGLPADPEITLNPSDWIELDLTVSEGQNLGGGDIIIQLSNPQGLLDPAGILFEATPPTNLAGSIIPFAWTSPWEVIQADPQSVYISGGNSQFNTVGEYDLMWGLMFHCEEPTDVIIEVVAAGLGVAEFDATFNPVIIYEPGEIIDSLVVIQPEPMTLSLLGLGGLALLRRRR
jgi:hypothetical protein